MLILGISAFYHDSAAALLVNGRIDAAAQEERFSRKKHDSSFPKHAIQFCLSNAGISLSDVDKIIFYEKPFIKFERLLETYLSFSPRGFSSFRRAIPVWIKEKLFQKHNIIKALHDIDPEVDASGKLMFTEHHQSHAASAFYPSPFDEAVVLTMDGVGEWATSSVAIGQGNRLEIIKELHFPHSLGLLYSAFTYYTGFKVNSGEYKLMGLAPFGNPKFANLIRKHLIDIKPDGSFHLDMTYFDYCTGMKMTNNKFHELFGAPPRVPEEKLTEFHMDLAASVQLVLEELVLTITRNLATETGIKNLCLAGGVALNCVANGRVMRDGAFDNIWVQPASGDAGGALGAALIAHFWHLDAPRVVDKKRDSMAGSFLGPAFSLEEIQKKLTALGATFHVLDNDALIETCATALNEGKAVGWHQGRMEFGPRALGGRSILGDARSPKMQSLLNLKVKYRESFRPFAPSVLREEVSNWFEIDCDSPYMLLVANVVEERRLQMTEKEQKLFGIDKLNVPRSDIPAVTHVDYSARIQTVHADTNPRYHSLISRFYEKTGCPILVNTSFNVRGEPIVCTPEDTFHCFMGTEIDMLALGNCILYKNEQDASLKKNYSNEFELD